MFWHKAALIGLGGVAAVYFACKLWISRGKQVVPEVIEELVVEPVIEPERPIRKNVKDLSEPQISIHAVAEMMSLSPLHLRIVKVVNVQNKLVGERVYYIQGGNQTYEIKMLKKNPISMKNVNSQETIIFTEDDKRQIFGGV